MPEGQINRPIVITWDANAAVEGIAAMQAQLDALDASLLRMGQSGTTSLTAIETRLGGISTGLAGIVSQANAAAEALARMGGVPAMGGGGVPVVPITGTINAGGESVSSGILVSQVRQIEEERLALSRLAQDVMATRQTSALWEAPAYAPITADALAIARAGAGGAGPAFPLYPIQPQDPYGTFSRAWPGQAAPGMDTGAFNNWWNQNLGPASAAGGIGAPPQYGSISTSMPTPGIPGIGTPEEIDQSRSALTDILSLQERLRYQQTGVVPSEYAKMAQEAPQWAAQVDNLTSKQLSYNQAVRMFSEGGLTMEEMQQGLTQGWIGQSVEAEKNSNIMGRLEFSMLRMIVVYGVFFQSIQMAMQAEQRLMQQEMEYQAVVERTAYVTGQSAEAASKQTLAAGALATQYGQTPNEGYQLQLQTARISPGDVQGQQELQTAALQLSTMTGAPATESLQRLISVEREWGLTSKDSAQILDLVAEAYKTTNVDTNAFVDTLAKGSATGQAYGLSLQGMAGYMAAFSQATGSIDPSRATQFFDAITQVTESTAKQQGLMELGIAVFDLQGNMLPLPAILDQVAAKWDTWNAQQQTSAAILLVNRRYAQDFFAVMQQYDLIGKNVDNFTNSQSQANEMLKNTNQLLEFQLARVKETGWNELVQGLLASAGGAEQLAGWLKTAADNMDLILGISQAASGLGVGRLMGAVDKRLQGAEAPQPGDPGFIGPVHPEMPGAPAGLGQSVIPPAPTQDYDWLNRVGVAKGMFGGSLPQVDQTKLSYDQLLIVEQQANDKAQEMVQIFAQQAAASQGLGTDQKAIDSIAQHITDQYKNHVAYLQSVDGRLLVITGLASQYANELAKANNLPPPSIQVTKLTPQELANDSAMANQMAQQYLQTIQASNMPLDQQQAILQQVQETWSKTYSIVYLMNGQMVMLTGQTAAFLGLAEQAANAMKAINPSIQSDPTMTAGYAQQLQGYLTQYENTLRGLGVQQTPQEYLIFGKDGQLFQFFTSSQAMTLAMDLLRQEVAKNTDTQLRGHYNIPGDFGYQPPTPWEFYARTGSTEKGPANYPWDFPSENPSMGFPATGITDSLMTTFGPIKQAMDPNTAATDANTNATVANTLALYDAASGQLVQQNAAGGSFAYDAASGQLVKQVQAGLMDPLRGRGTLTQGFGQILVTTANSD